MVSKIIIFKYNYMKKIIFFFTIFFLIIWLSSCSNSHEWITIQSNTWFINSWNTINSKTISWSLSESRIDKKWCEVIYENVSKVELKKRRFSFFIEWDCKDKIITWDSTQEWNLLETPNWVKFEIQDWFASYSIKKIYDFIKNKPDEKGVLINNFLTENINNNPKFEINISKYTIYDEKNKQVIDYKIVWNFWGFILSNYSESFQKNLNENNLDETYNELKTILSTVKELPSIDVSYDYETVDLNKIIVKWKTFILKDKNWFEKIVTVDPTRIYKDLTVEDFEYQCRKTCSFHSLKWNSIEWEIEIDWNYYSEFTDIATWTRISWWFENTWGFDNLN